MLGGPFDTDWWQLSWDKDGNDSDTDAYTKISSSYNKQYTARIEKRGNAGSAVVEPGDEGHETEPEAPETVDEPWRKGLRRMVDVDSPLVRILPRIDAGTRESGALQSSRFLL